MISRLYDARPYESKFSLDLDCEKRTELPFNETQRVLHMECGKFLTQPS